VWPCRRVSAAACSLQRCRLLCGLKHRRINIINRRPVCAGRRMLPAVPNRRVHMRTPGHWAKARADLRRRRQMSPGPPPGSAWPDSTLGSDTPPPPRAANSVCNYVKSMVTGTVRPNLASARPAITALARSVPACLGPSGCVCARVRWTLADVVLRSTPQWTVAEDRYLPALLLPGTAADDGLKPGGGSHDVSLVRRFQK
jgi:hypothetical protein